MVVQMINWQTEYSIPIQSFAFVLANDVPYCIFLTWRPGRESWRSFVIPNARKQHDLLTSEELRWSKDLFEEAGVMFRDDQMVDAQKALVRLLAAKLGIDEKEIVAARNGRPIKQDDKPRLSGAQLHQVARIQPQTRRR